jgi:hypothetical protein
MFARPACFGNRRFVLLDLSFGFVVGTSSTAFSDVISAPPSRKCRRCGLAFLLVLMPAIESDPDSQV